MFVFFGCNTSNKSPNPIQKKKLKKEKTVLLPIKKGKKEKVRKKKKKNFLLHEVLGRKSDNFGKH